MKLKKILALALSGIMAVSMLAGCFGGGTSSDTVKRDGGRVRAAVNDSLAALDVEFEADRAFAADLGTVANSATPADIAGMPTFLTGDARSTLLYVTKASWMQQAPDKAGTYVCALWFDGDHSAYDVGKTMALYLDMASAITDTFDVTDASLEALEVTIGTGENAEEVWLVGVIVTLADKKA